MGNYAVAMPCSGRQHTSVYHVVLIFTPAPLADCTVIAVFRKSIGYRGPTVERLTRSKPRLQRLKPRRTVCAGLRQPHATACYGRSRYISSGRSADAVRSRFVHCQCIHLVVPLPTSLTTKRGLRPAAQSRKAWRMAYHCS